MTNTLMTLDTALQDLITGAVAAAETAGGFVAEEAPIVVEQLLAWNFTVSLLLFLAGAIVVLAMAILIKWINKCSKGDKYSYEWLDADGCEIFLLLPFIGGVALIGCNLTWLKIAIAPKLYLLEYAADLIK